MGKIFVTARELCVSTMKDPTHVSVSQDFKEMVLSAQV